MSLLKSLMKETAAAGATGAGAISTGGGHQTMADLKKRKKGSLWSGGLVNGKKRNTIRRVINMKESFIHSLTETLGVDHGKTDFDASDVLSKIDSAQKKEYLNDDTTAFGLEDDQGNLVKVYVNSEQADEFENALASMLAGIQDQEDTDENAGAPEIAEVLYELKDKFDIVDVEWPGIEGDEEEEQEVVDQDIEGGAGAGGMGAGMDAEGGEGAAGGEEDMGLGDEEGLEGEGEDEDMEADEDSAKSALQSVIDMMKADAEARMADAQAREAEARAKEAEATANAGAAKARREEQVFDMEAAEKEEKERKKEAETQAKLARHQHRRAQDAEAQLSFESQDDLPFDMRHDGEEECDEITLTELTNLILKNLRHN